MGLSSLVTRLHHDDESALRELILAHFDSIASLAYHYVGRQDIAADIAQDIFINLWERRHHLDDRGDLLHYLRRSVRNRALNVLRDTKTAQRAHDAAAHTGDPESRHVENDAIDRLEANDYVQLLRRVTAKMSPRVREVALLHYEQGLEPGEIAALLEVAPRTIYNQLRTAMAAFMAALKPGHSGEGRNPHTSAWSYGESGSSPE